ncbi:YchJ family protein [Persicobacter diffluens]
MSMICPCGRQRLYADCCGRYIDGETPAPTPLDLMRSRYTAHVKVNVDYITKTTLPEKQGEIDQKAVLDWAYKTEWSGLEIVSTNDGPEENEGVVEFKAYYKDAGKTKQHHERSIFEKRDEQWYYVGGAINPKAKSDRVMRNEPCPCGSGKKYKKCCGK